MSIFANSGAQPDQPDLLKSEPSPKNQLTIRVDDKDVVIKINYIRIHGKEKEIQHLSQAELKAIKNLFEKAMSEAHADSKVHSSATLTQVRITANPDNVKELGEVSLIKTYAPQKEKEAPTEETVRLKDAQKASTVALRALEDLQNLTDEYPEKDLRYSIDEKENKDARAAARDPTPFIGPVGELGTERLDKYQTIAMARRTSEAALDHFKERLEILQKDAKSNVDQIKRCKDIIAYHEKVLQNIKQCQDKDDKGWLDCNYWRFLIRDHQDYDAAARAYISGAVNMRMQTYTPHGGGPGIQFLRTGVMADMRNTWYSAKFLREIEEAPLNKAIQKIGEKAQRVVSRLEKENVLRMDKTDEVLMLFKNNQTMEGLNKIIEYLNERFDDKADPPGFKERCRLQSAGRALLELREIAHEKLKLEGVTPGVLQAVREGRQRVLESQMLQMLQAQVAAHASKLGDPSSTKPFKMGYLTFINCHSAKLDKTGWMHDENVELEDMTEIFKVFNGKTLIFEEIEAAFIDAEGAVHLPAPTPAMVGKKRKLETLFMAVTPQNNTNNDGTQKSINDAARLQLVKLLDVLSSDDPRRKKIAQLYEKLDFRKGNYDIAEEIAYLLIESGEYAVGIGCASAKDRTGLVAERLVARAANEGNNPQESGLAPVTVQELLNSKKCAAVRVVYENTGEDAFKADPRGIPGGLWFGIKKGLGLWWRGDQVIKKWQKDQEERSHFSVFKWIQHKVINLTIMLKRFARAVKQRIA